MTDDRSTLLKWPAETKPLTIFDQIPANSQ